VTSETSGLGGSHLFEGSLLAFTWHLSDLHNMLMCYKILHHSVDLHQDFFTIWVASLKREAIRIDNKLIIPNSRINARANYLSVRIINVWNRLSDEMMFASSVSSFNYKLINTDLKFGLSLLVNLSSTLNIIIFNVLLILLTCVTKLCRYFNRYFRILSYNVTF